MYLQVWQKVKDKTPEKLSIIDRMEKRLREKEEERRESIETELVQMVRNMNDIAYICEGDTQRLMERESLEINTGILDNRYSRNLCIPLDSFCPWKF